MQIRTMHACTAASTNHGRNECQFSLSCSRSAGAVRAPGGGDGGGGGSGTGQTVSTTSGSADSTVVASVASAVRQQQVCEKTR